MTTLKDKASESAEHVKNIVTENATKIGELNMSPDLLQTLLILELWMRENRIEAAA